MNVKKTIASIAAIAMVASATSLAPLFTGTSIAADELETVGAETPEDELIEDPNAGISLYSVADRDHSGETLQGVDGIDNATGTVAVEGNNVTVTLTQTSEAAIEGTAQGGSGQENYHVIIDVAGIDGEWSFKSGYGYDVPQTPEYNITSGKLKLWLPITPDGEYTIVLKKGSDDSEETKTIVVKTVVVPYEAPAPTLTLGGSGNVDQGGTGTVAVDGTTVTVTLDSASAGLSQEGNDEGTPNYHVVIPVTGLDGTWEFDSTSQYQYDSVGNKTWNIDTNSLKLWLPVESGSCTVVLKKTGTDTKVTFVVRTVNGSTVVTPPPAVTEPTDAEKVAAAKGELETALAAAETNWDFRGKTLEEIKSEVEAWFAAQGFDFAENVTINYGDVDEYGGRWIGFGIVFGEEGNWSLGTYKDVTAAPVVVPDTPVTIPDPFIYVPGTGASVSVSPEAISNTVSSPAQITASRKAEITVNAAETEVTPAMVEAFVKNKNAKTLTLQYSYDLKVSVNKSDISDADANLDFSVTGEKFLSSKAIKNNKVLKKATKIVQIDFVNKGDLEGIDKVTIKSKVGIGYAGKTVTIYEYKNGKLVKVGVGKVNGAGLVKFDTDHLGQFVIVVK